MCVWLGVGWGGGLGGSCWCVCLVPSSKDSSNNNMLEAQCVGLEIGRTFAGTLGGHWSCGRIHLLAGAATPAKARNQPHVA